MEWRPIKSAPCGSRVMFVVKAFDVRSESTNDFPYTTDPYCVWQLKRGDFMRWPYKFPPTHWAELPPEKND